MKNRLFGMAAIIAAIAFASLACGGGSGGSWTNLPSPYENTIWVMNGVLQ